MVTDYFGSNCEALARKRLFLLDMDGTIYNENSIFPGTLEFLDMIRKIGGKYIFITNNSSKSVDDYIQKVQKMGIAATEENFLTSTQATAMYLKKNFPGGKVYVQATESCVRELRSAGIDVTLEVDRNAKAVLLGFDLEITGAKLRNTCEMLGFKDVAYIATNPDLVCPVSFGYVPDCGSIAEMIYNATGRRPKFIGKPEPTMIEIAREKTGCSKPETVAVGDRIYTDIKAGLNAGITSVLVLSGESTLKTIQTSEDEPTLTFSDVKEIAEKMKQLLNEADRDRGVKV